jgi:hypothetical protein
MNVCREVGDFGHRNVWGQPYLMFNVHCQLEEDHNGPHRGQEEIRIKPSYEPNGVKIDAKSVTVEPSFVWVTWENK